jgi:hypothetical protein
VEAGWPAQIARRKYSFYRSMQILILYIWRRLLIRLRVTGLNLGNSEKEYFGVHSANKKMQEAEAWGFAVMFVRQMFYL